MRLTEPRIDSFCTLSLSAGGDDGDATDVRWGVMSDSRCFTIVQRLYHVAHRSVMMYEMWVMRDDSCRSYYSYADKNENNWSQRTKILLPTGVKPDVECTEIAEAFASLQPAVSCESLPVCV